MPSFVPKLYTAEQPWCEMQRRRDTVSWAKYRHDELRNLTPAHPSRSFRTRARLLFSIPSPILIPIPLRSKTCTCVIMARFIPGISVVLPPTLPLPKQEKKKPNEEKGGKKSIDAITNHLKPK